MVPIIKLELRDKFLEEIEDIYNNYDHKKIRLSSMKLKRMMTSDTSKLISASKTPPLANGRPQTGCNWNQNISPFLRPYTASKPN